MIEKFSDYESVQYLNKEGEFVFVIKDYELKDSSNGNTMAVFEVESKEAGKTTLYHTLSPKARWSYNNLIKCCLKLNTPKKIEAFECDYETIGQSLIGKSFVGKVEREIYKKPIKMVNPEDGTFIDSVEEKETYKVKSYDFVK